jgi:glycosyltransferase involved in cell wall biosynthesis
MKLVIQIPCYNEEETLPVTLAALPKSLEGVNTIEVLVIDDGSTDNTVQRARSCGVRHVLKLSKNQGLATAFMVGLDKSLELGADIIVNTDADNQYCADDIQKIIDPIIKYNADMVIGARPIKSIPHFSILKKIMQMLGSFVVRLISGTKVEDAPSGFRALSRQTALRLNVFSKYTYTLETIIQAGEKNMNIVSIPVRVNREERPSRLVKNIYSYIAESLLTMFRIFTVYKAFAFFSWLTVIAFTSGCLLGFRFLYFYFTGGGQGHIQSLILAAILLIVSVQFFAMGILADLISSNRKIVEELQYRQRLRDLSRTDDSEKESETKVKAE